MSINFYIQRYKNRYKWKKKNRHNDTLPQNIFSVDSVFVGRETYGNLIVDNYNDKYKLYIGNYCSIATNVMFILDADHYTKHISTFPFKVKILGERFEGVSKGDIIVDDDVWIGYGAIILSGVHIGQGAVVAAGAVVTNDVPPYAIVGGIPANIIKYRFEQDIIEELLKVDYNKLSKKDIKNHIDDLYAELKDKEQLEWMPKIRSTKSCGKKEK